MPFEAPPLRVAVVDDDSSIVRLVTTLIDKDFGDRFQAIGFDDSLRAKAFFHGNFCEVLFTDIEMPGVSGLDLIDYVRRVSPYTQIFVMTGQSTLDSLNRALSAGATDYLLKPLERHAVYDRLREAEGRARRWQEALTGTLETVWPIAH